MLKINIRVSVLVLAGGQVASQRVFVLLGQRIEELAGDRVRMIHWVGSWEEA